MRNRTGETSCSALATPLALLCGSRTSPEVNGADSSLMERLLIGLNTREYTYRLIRMILFVRAGISHHKCFWVIDVETKHSSFGRSARRGVAYLSAGHVCCHCQCHGQDYPHPSTHRQSYQSYHPPTNQPLPRAKLHRPANNILLMR